MDLFKTWIVETPIAHRGLHDKTSPENSLGAISKAIEKGFAVEIDVQLLSDGTIVLFNDESLARMTGNDGYLKFLNKDDLKSLNLKDSKETIPTLEQALKLIDGKVPVMIEIKNKYNKVGPLEQAVIDLLKKYKGEYAVVSFNPFTLEYIKQHAPHIIRGQNSSFFKGEKISFLKRIYLKSMSFNKKVSQPHFINYETTNLPNRYVKKFKNLPLLAFPVQSKEEYLRVVKYCDNVIFENFYPEI